MEFEFEEMNKEMSKLSVEIFGPSGSGKTTAAFKIAQGIRNQLYPGSSLKNIGLYIDTENRSSLKAVGRNVGGESLESLELFDFKPPFDILKLAQLLEFAVNVKGKKIIILDSASAFWSGKDGILERAAELDVELADKKKAYGAWSEKEIISKKNLLKAIACNSGAHLIVCTRAKTEYVMEPNFKGKMTPKAIGLKEDMQSDVRYEFDVVLSLDRETHNVGIVKDRIGYEEIRLTSTEPEGPLTIKDGEIMTHLVSQGFTLEEIAQRKINKLVAFILDEKLHKSTRVQLLEDKNGKEFTKEALEKLPYDSLKKIAQYING